MTEVRAKLAELGLVLPVAAKPVAAYVPAIRTGNLVFTAGQLPMVDGALSASGKVGDKVSVEDAKKLAQICAVNALASVETVADVNKIGQVTQDKLSIARHIESILALPYVDRKAIAAKNFKDDIPIAEKQRRYHTLDEVAFKGRRTTSPQKTYSPATP